jgi:hypothetical protein
LVYSHPGAFHAPDYLFPFYIVAFGVQHPKAVLVNAFTLEWYFYFPRPVNPDTVYFRNHFGDYFHYVIGGECEPHPVFRPYAFPCNNELRAAARFHAIQPSFHRAAVKFHD